MTAVCGGGTSGVKPGFASVVDYSLGLAAAILQFRNLKWAIPVLPLVNIPSLSLSSFCSTDPPAMPTFTSAETEAVLKLQFGADFDSGVSKFKDLILHALWYDACQCTSGTLDAFPAVTIPTGTPIFQPPVPSTNTPCAAWGPQTVTSFVGPSFGLSTNQPIKYVVMTVTNTITSGSGSNANCDMALFLDDYPTAGPGTLLSSLTFNCPAGQVTQRVIACPIGTNFVRPSFNTVTGTGASTYVYQIDGFCSDLPPNAAALPCCPPDIATQAVLDTILKMVTLIQRQSVPFAYVYGTNHEDLVDDGEISCSGLLGVAVDVTTLPASYGRDSGTPEQLYDLGFVTLGTADGWTSSRRIDHDGTLLLPRAAGVFTAIGYSLRPGVVVDIRELVREP